MKLTADEIGEFFKLYKSLIFYINTKKKLIDGLESPYDVDMSNDIAELRNFAVKDHSLIDSFVGENPFKFTDDELKTVESWKKGILSKFLIVKYDKDYTMFFHPETRRCYGVLYLNDSFGKMLGPYLPVHLETWIIPFNGKIIYDGLILSSPISFGSTLGKSVISEGMEAAVKYGVVTSFDMHEDKTASDEELLRFYMKTEQNRGKYWEEIDELSEKSPELEAVYHQEYGRYRSRKARAGLRKVGVSGFFGMIDDTVIAGAQSRKEFDKIVKGLVPKEKMDWIFYFKV
ncbi:MAG: hypothetical protein DRN71_05015 [Candidatus Nanohalarchaeota archaeon]|nr:MAG: hypothetical protein DRN71_05015 [Candidatus Nanohaloarchaeota archaeon]